MAQTFLLEVRQATYVKARIAPTSAGSCLAHANSRTDGFTHAEPKNALVQRLTPVALAGADYRPTAEIVVPLVQLMFAEEGPQNMLLVTDISSRTGRLF